MSTMPSRAAPPAHPSRPARVAFFATCLADGFFAEACRDAVRVLRHFGVDVNVPSGQTCCGQPAYNTGHREEAARMARHTARTFADAEYVVLPSGSCAGMIRSFYPDLLGERQGPERAYELSEFLVRVLGVASPGGSSTLGGAPLGSGLKGRRVVYHHGCHALRELGVREEPLALLRACGAEVMAWDGDTECCGFGGLFSAKFPEVSAGMADRKLDALPPGVDTVTSADGGCLLQLSGRARRRDMAPTVEPLLAPGAPPEADRGSPLRDARFVHLATLLREGLGA
jgi:L-lactate dehydrogenase complex protein LldE